eukprot:5822352-Amphidinium_carterae.1
MDAVWKEEDLPIERPTLKTDNRFHYYRKGRATKRPSSCPWWTVYGHRGTNPLVAMLCPYEFAMYCQLVQTNPPRAEDMREDMVQLTDKGRARVLGSPGKHVPQLTAGEDYAINEAGGADW